MIFDPESAIPGPSKEALSRLLSDHFQLTREAVYLAVLPRPSRTAEVLGRWREATRRADIRHVLIALYPDVGAAEIANDFDLDSLLTRESTETLHRQIGELLQVDTSDAVGRAAASGVMRILELLRSPLVETGEARLALEQAGIPLGGGTGSNAAWAILVALIGIGMIAAIPTALMTGDSHYSAEGRARTHALAIASRFLVRTLPRSKRPSSPIRAGGIDGTW